VKKTDRPKVFYRNGWRYRLQGQERGPFGSDKEAGEEMKREAFVLRSVARAKEGRPMTWADRKLEGIA